MYTLNYKIIKLILPCSIYKLTMTVIFPSLFTHQFPWKQWIDSVWQHWRHHIISGFRKDGYNRLSTDSTVWSYGLHRYCGWMEKWSDYVVLFIFVCYSCWMNVSCCYHSADFIIIFCKCLLCMEYRLICCPYWGIICTFHYSLYWTTLYN